MDDHALILQNRHIGDLEHLQLNPFATNKQSSLGENYVYFRPITHIADLISFRLFEKEVFGYHLMNLLVFFACSIAIYEFILLLFQQPGLAFLTSALFSTHPINAVLVNYTSTTGFIMLIVFTIFGLMNHLKFIETKHIVRLALSIIFFVLSLLCHETAISYPIYLALILLFVNKLTIRRTILSIFPLLCVIAFYLIFRMNYASLKTGVIDQIAVINISFAEYIAQYYQLCLHYFTNLLFLKNIVLISSATQVSNNIGLWISIFLVTLIILLSVLCFAWKNNRKSFALCWILVGLGPVTLACFSRPSMGLIISPHWLLVSTIGYCLLIAILFYDIYKINKKKLSISLSIFLIFSFAFVSRQYNTLWANEINYCQYMLHLSPNIPLVKFWLANAYYKKGDLANAKYYFTQTINGAENDWKGYLNLGVIEGQSGNKNMEISYYLKALQLKPDSSDALNNLATVYMEQGEFIKAEQILKKAISYDSNLAEAHKNLAIIQKRLKN